MTMTEPLRVAQPVGVAWDIGQDTALDDAVLVVDLDGTLCRSDTLHEALFGLAAAHPGQVPGLLSALLGGKTAFKRHVANSWIVPGAGLPLNDTVIAMLQQARAAGRRTALVSASDQRQVDAVAAHVGLFDEAFGTGGEGSGARNLSGAAKADFLVARYGEKGFDYLGDATVDLAVWARARRTLTLGAGPALRRAAEATGSQVEHIDPLPALPDRIRLYLRAMRPHQWSKNLLIFLPLLSAHDFSAWGAALAAFVAFCLTASSVYILNDLVDLQADRAHPRKRLRPFASGAVPLMHGAILASALLLGAVLISLLFTPPLFLGTLAVYYIATVAYSFWLKRKLIVDVLTLAGLYTIRIIAGAAAAGLALSPWMLGFSMFIFLSLAAVKRQAELTDQLRDGRKKTAGRAYETEDLPVLRDIALSSGYASVLVFALYINSEDVLKLYRTPQILWLICPLLLYWISRMVMMTHRGFMHDDPIVFAAKDRISQIVVLTCAAIILATGFL
jgi:4-hydroxybenzoate polyprenyltransferase/phosphoserine phosphatase